MDVGDKVICVDATIRPEALLSVSKMFQEWVVKDSKYTIREFLYNDGIVDGVLLEEISNIPVFIDLLGREQEPAFGLFRFRKLEVEEMEEELEDEFYLEGIFEN